MFTIWNLETFHKIYKKLSFLCFWPLFFFNWKQVFLYRPSTGPQLGLTTWSSPLASLQQLPGHQRTSQVVFAVIEFLTFLSWQHILSSKFVFVFHGFFKNFFFTFKVVPRRWLSLPPRLMPRCSWWESTTRSTRLTCKVTELGPRVNFVNAATTRQCIYNNKLL